MILDSSRLWRGMAVVSLAFVFTACAARQDSKQINAEIGCDFDSKKVCEQVATQPVSTSGGLTTSNRTYLQQNSLATAWMAAPIKAPGGSEVDVQCQIRTQDMKVIYAYATPSGKVSDSDRQWLIQTGLCREPGSNAAPTPAPGVAAPQIKPEE